MPVDADPDDQPVRADLHPFNQQRHDSRLFGREQFVPHRIELLQDRAGISLLQLPKRAMRRRHVDLQGAAELDTGQIEDRLGFGIDGAATTRKVSRMRSPANPSVGDQNTSCPRFENVGQKLRYNHLENRCTLPAHRCQGLIDGLRLASDMLHEIQTDIVEQKFAQAAWIDV